MEEEEAADPVGDGVGGAVLAEVVAGERADEVEQTRRLRRSISGWSGGEHRGTPGKKIVF
jgi:hypothetical protein